MKEWIAKHFTIGGIITVLSVVGAIYVFADDVKETEVVVTDLVEEVGLNTKHSERTDIHHTGERLVETFVTEPIFKAYKESQKELDEQFQKQLFIQLERMEKKLN